MGVLWYHITVNNDREVRTMTIRVTTAAGRVITGYVLNAKDVVRVLRDLSAEGHKCIKWEVAR